MLGPDGAGDTSDVINAIDWVIAHKTEYRIRVINLSLGHPVFESYREDPLCLAVERAVSAGLVVVAAAGNMGKTEDGRPIVGGVISPGNTPSALTVGALNTRATRAAVRRCDGDVQLAGSDAVRRRAEAGAGGAGQQDHRAVGGGLVPGRDVPGAGVGASARTRTSR